VRNHPSRGVLFVFVLAALAIAGAAAQRADAKTAVTPPKTFAASLVPSFTVRGATVIEALSVTNTSSSSSGYRLGSADVAIPSGFKVIATNWSFGPFRDRSEGRFGFKDWDASVSGGAIHLRAHSATSSENDTLKPGQTVAFFIWVVVPCLSPDSTTWSATSTEGFTAGSSPTLRAFANCSFAFGVGNPQHVGAPISSTVRTLDGFGWPTQAFDGTAAVTGTLGTGPDGNAPQYNTALSFTKGVATGQTLATPYAIETGRQLTVTSGPIHGSSNLFDVVGGDPDHLAFIQQPTDVDAGASITPAVTVGVYDAGGNLENVAQPIALSFGNDPVGGSTLGGTATQTSAAGVATFNDLTVDQAGDGFTLTATSGALSATSDPFNVNAVQQAPQCDGRDCQTEIDPVTHTSVTFPEGRIDSVTFGPPNEVYSCLDHEGPSIGAIATYLPNQDSGSDPFHITVRYDKTEVQNYISQHNGASPVFCIDKGDSGGFQQVDLCTRTENQTPCIVSQDFETDPNVHTNVLILDYAVTFFVTPADPRVAMGN
jgi:hypothetical protein